MAKNSKSERPTAEPMRAPGIPDADGPMVPAPADLTSLPAQMTPDAPAGSTLEGRPAFEPAQGSGDKPAFEPTRPGAPRTAFSPPDRPGMPAGQLPGEYPDPGPLRPLGDGPKPPDEPPAVLVPAPADRGVADAIRHQAGAADGARQNESGARQNENGSRQAYREELARMEADRAAPGFDAARYWELHYLANGLTPPSQS